MFRSTKTLSQTLQTAGRRFSTSAHIGTKSKKGSLFLYAAVGAATATGVAFLVADKYSASGDDGVVVPPKHPWGHSGFFTSFDHLSIRRGWQVYKEVCSACHSLRQIYWRHLVGVVGTEEEVKEWAAASQYQDGPDDAGEMYDRDGKLTDRLPLPYPNEQAARAGNAGALPPDLSLMKKARPHGEDYIFSILTGYREAPHGMQLREGLHYNPYFPGNAIGMRQALFDEMIEYEDGTEASISQMAKDVTTFLCWTAEPEHDERKKLGVKTILLLALMIPPVWYWKRFKWSVVKTRQVRFTNLPKRFY